MKMFRRLSEYFPWLGLLLLLELFTGTLLWLGDIRVFDALFPLLFLWTGVVFIVLGWVLIRRDHRREEAMRAFLADPEEEAERTLFHEYGEGKRELLTQFVESIRRRDAEIETTRVRLSDYEDYVEQWAHEIKLPLSLLTLLLDNHGEKIPAEIRAKLDHVRNRTQENISQILFYYRVKSERKDYRMEEFSIAESVEEVLADYRPLFEEKGFRVCAEETSELLFTDRRSVEFMLGQIVGNAVKYCAEEPNLEISVEKSEGVTTVRIRDNGQGVKECDLPHLFEKGFTGDSGEVRKKSTGMGLYLVKILADDLNVGVEISSEWQRGFEIRLSFPS